MWAVIPDWLKVGAGALAGAALLALGSFYLGKSEGRSEGRAEMQVEAAKEALERITKLEKNNAAFMDLSARHRCLVFMRDSRLPDSACD
ncbi:hypothetical protein [Rhizobium sp. RM]|uniref:hypothetical protein n=1 Tax=Rhizobium sp. RM TaxID=2748079 RepID=UPI00110E260E|nr:hypothetical protein [Rhizobium sp. RM]NWJ24781.1 hypothetical protein [Rhizobium sp. RM]TMV16580.1 hypothetical protein BJG94_19285 [Rhizobium sp. Td3]